MTTSIIYRGDLRCECTHIQSGSILETDAPTDNFGKGERFSPTDTVCVALATCIITTMGIKAQPMHIDFKGTRLDVTKHMISNPRRIGKIEVTLHLKTDNPLSDEQKKQLEEIGNNCPVIKSLHPDIEKAVVYSWG
jgi:uncharacterized OsmC-like protein